MARFQSLIDQLLGDLAPFVTPRPDPVGVSTPVPRLTVWTSTRRTCPTPAVFEPMFYVVLRGRKVLIMGAHRLDLPTGASATSSFGLPYFHQFTEADPALPYVGVSLHLDTNLLTQVMLDVPKPESLWTPAMSAGDLGDSVGDAFARLVGLVNAPDDIAGLAPHYEAELYYRLLKSSLGLTLRQVGDRSDRFLRLKATADKLVANPGQAIAIGDLAASAGMSLSSFHRHFKAVTGYSPLAFQRQMRLREAKKLLAAGEENVCGVAYRVGYLSPSQFSREYKAMFGTSPVVDLQRQEPRRDVAA